MHPYTFRFAILLPVVALTGAAIYLTDFSAPTESAIVPEASLTASSAAIAKENLATPPPPARYAAPREIQKTETISPAHFSSNPVKANWEKEILGLVNQLGVPKATKVERLLAMVRNLPPDGQVLAMEHATEMIPDGDYIKLRPLIFQLTTSEDLRETVLHDVLTRSERIRMPTLVELLRQPANPEQAEIRGILQAYLDVDYGPDPAKWEVAVRKFLVENPDI